MAQGASTPPRGTYESSKINSYNRAAAERERVERAQYQRRQVRVVQKQVIEEQPRGVPKIHPLKGGYILLFLMIGLTIGKDLLDVITTLLDLLGAGLSATVVGAVIGVPLGIFIEAVDKIATLFVDATVLFYFWYIGGKFALRLVLMSIGAIIDAVPELDVLPITTLTFVFAFVVGRVINKVESTALGGAATSIIAKKI